MTARDRMQELDSQARQIGEITVLVGEIADQTNLLALNAAIEAARDLRSASDSLTHTLSQFLVQGA